MKTSIRAKVLPLSIAGIIITGTVLGFVAVNTQNNTLRNVYKNEIETVKKTYIDLENNDIKMLKAAMTDFMTNQDIKDIYMQNNRETLYAATKDLYTAHKELGITHFYFHRTDGTNFLRVHSSSTFDDVIPRATLKIARETNGWGTGIEMGKTAFALRVVAPYYNAGNVVGYLEYGEEIDHLNKIIKSQTGDDVLTIVDKTKLPAATWAAYTQSKGLRDNYNDMKDYVVIDSTNASLSEVANYCWTENNLNSVTDKGNLFDVIKRNGRQYSCGGFNLIDANNNKVGVVVSVRDVTNDETTLRGGIYNSIILVVVMIIILSLIVLLVINRIIILPLKKLTEAGNKINDGAIDTPLPVIKSNDEIKDLSIVMESLVGAIKMFKNKKK